MPPPINYMRRDTLHGLLRMLDKEVTGKNETYKAARDFPNDFACGGAKYHLSDGHSRVAFGYRSGSLIMTMDSSEQAKAKFEKLYMLRAIIETFFLGGI